MGRGSVLARELRRGEIRLIRFPKPDKERPALVLTRDSALRYLAWVSVAPITSTLRGVPSEVCLGIDDGMKNPCAVNLYNITAVRKELLGRRIAVLGPTRMREICAAISFAFGCDE